MSNKRKETVVVIRQDQLTEDVYSLWLQTPEIAKKVKAGQFVSLYSEDGSRLLPRPISICEVNHKENSIRLVYRIVGGGTQEFSNYHAGKSLTVLGPLGNGFPITKEKKSFIIGGGIGIPPMLQLAKEIKGEKLIVAGYKDALFLNEELQKQGTLYIATEDGSAGTKGNVMDCIQDNNLHADVIYACGPNKMLQAIKQFAEEHKIPAYISMEEKMACGIGACLSCVCKTIEKDSYTNVNNTRICKEGPVFLAQEVTF